MYVYCSNIFFFYKLFMGESNFIMQVCKFKRYETAQYSRP